MLILDIRSSFLIAIIPYHIRTAIHTYTYIYILILYILISFLSHSERLCFFIEPALIASFIMYLRTVMAGHFIHNIMRDLDTIRAFHSLHKKYNTINILDINTNYVGHLCLQFTEDVFFETCRGIFPITRSSCCQVTVAKWVVSFFPIFIFIIA